MSFFSFKIFIFGWFILPFSVSAQHPADWFFRVEKPDSLGVGDTLTIITGTTVTFPAEFKFNPDSTWLKILEPLPAQQTSTTEGGNITYTLRQPFVWWGFKPDTLIPAKFVLKSTAGADSVWLITPALYVTPHLFSSPDDSLPRAEKGIYETPIPLFYWIVGLLILCLLVAIGYFIYKKIQNKKRLLGQVPELPEIIKTPYEIFEEGMVALKLDQDTWSADVKTYYSRLVEQLKNYLSLVTKRPILEMTTEETLDWFTTRPDISTHLPDQRDLFYRADMIKFAKQSAVSDQMMADFDMVKSAVKKIDLMLFPISISKGRS